MKSPACLLALGLLLTSMSLGFGACQRSQEDLWSPGKKPTAYSGGGEAGPRGVAEPRRPAGKAGPGAAARAAGPRKPGAPKLDPAVMDALVGHLGTLQQAHRDGNRRAQDEAVAAISKLDRKTVEPALLAILKRNLQSLGTPAAVAIGRLKIAPGLRLVSDRLLSDDVFLAQAAAEALGYLGDKRASLRLVEVVQRHASPSVRAAALQSLGKLGDKTVVPKVAVATKDPAPEGRAAAARLLTKLGNAVEHREQLTALLDDEAAQVRTAAAMALAELRAPNALDALVKLLSDRSEDARRGATKALLAFPNRVEVRNKLIYALEHGDGAARLSYSQVLKQVCDCSCLGDITHLTKHSENAFVRNAADTLAQDLILGGCKK